jgi:hypothetical protein
MFVNTKKKAYNFSIARFYIGAKTSSLVCHTAARSNGDNRSTTTRRRWRGAVVVAGIIRVDSAMKGTSAGTELLMTQRIRDAASNRRSLSGGTKGGEEGGGKKGDSGGDIPQQHEQIVMEIIANKGDFAGGIDRLQAVLAQKGAREIQHAGILRRDSRKRSKATRIIKHSHIDRHAWSNDAPSTRPRREVRRRGECAVHSTLVVE